MSGGYFNPAHSLDRAAAAHPERISMWYGERAWSVAQSAQCTIDLSCALRDLGVREGRRVALIARNSPWHLFMHVACARLGAVFVPLSYRLPDEQLLSVCASVRPQLLVADPETACGAANRVREQGAKYVQHFFVIDDDSLASLSEELAPDEGLLECACEYGWLPFTALFDRGRQMRLPRVQTSAIYTGDFSEMQHVAESAIDSTVERGAGSAIESGADDLAHCAHSSRSSQSSLFSDSVLFGNFGNMQEQALNCAQYPEGLGAILLTSGTSGEPKFVGLTHENLWWGSRNFREGFEYSNRDTELVVAPMSHIGGFNGTTLDLFSHGGTVVVVRQFVPSEVVRELERRCVCMMFAVPAMYMALLRDSRFSAQSLPAFRLPLTGGGAVSPDMIRALTKVGLQPLNVWGMTETSAAGCYLPAEHSERRAGSIGRPFAHVQVKIAPCEAVISADSASLVGELWVRGPNVAINYWAENNYWEENVGIGSSSNGGVDSSTDSNSDTNADRGKGQEKEKSAESEFEKEKRNDSENFWLHTGDLVRLDSEGYLWIIGRKDDLISTGGETVAPQEVEEVLMRHEHIREAAVIGIPDPVWGQVVAAAIVLSGRKEPSLDDIREFARAYLADYKLPRVCIVLSALPLNANGKIDRAALAAFV